MEELFAHTPDVSGPQRDHHVPGLEGGEQELCNLPHVRYKCDIPMPVSQGTVGNLLATHPWDHGFSGRVHLRHYEEVSLVKCGKELLEQMFGPCVPVGLKDHDDPPAKAILGGIERGMDLGRVVAVVIDDENPAGLSFYLEPTIDAGELLQPFPDHIKLEVQIETHRDGGQRVAHIVDSWDPESKLAQDFLARHHDKLRSHPLQDDLPRGDVGLGPQPIGDKTLFHTREEGLDILLVEAQDRGPVKGDLIDELKKGLLNMCQVAVVIQMLGINGCHHSQGGRKLEKRPVALICLCHQEVSPPQLRIGP